MRVIKVINNSLVMVRDENGNPCIVSGKGIGFNCRPNDEIRSVKIEQKFTLKSKGIVDRLTALVECFPLAYIKVCDEVVNMIKRELKTTIDDNLYLALVDHISYAIERKEKGLRISTNLNWEMKCFYPSEYRIGEKALEIIRHRLNVQLPEDEAAFISFHLVNANIFLGEDKIKESLLLMKDIVEIVQEYFSINITESSMKGSRFLSHIKYLSGHVLEAEGHGADSPAITDLMNQLDETDPEYSCVVKIEKYLKDQYAYQMNAKQYRFTEDIGYVKIQKGQRRGTECPSGAKRPIVSEMPCGREKNRRSTYDNNKRIPRTYPQLGRTVREAGNPA